MNNCPHNNPSDDVCRSHRQERRMFPKENLWPECGGQCGRVLPSLLGSKKNLPKTGGLGESGLCHLPRNQEAARPAGSNPAPSAKGRLTERQCAGLLNRGHEESCRGSNPLPSADILDKPIGVVAGRPKAAVLKTVDPQGSVGSTPTRSAKTKYETVGKPGMRRVRVHEKPTHYSEAKHGARNDVRDFSPPEPPAQLERKGMIEAPALAAWAAHATMYDLATPDLQKGADSFIDMMKYGHIRRVNSGLMFIVQRRGRNT